jgi:lipid A biosynthesis lauroyl/palmitoleoyl acyltransferase
VPELTDTCRPERRTPYRWRHGLAWLAAGLLWGVTRLPYGGQLLIGRGLGRLIRWLARDRRHIARTNLTLCFPDGSGSEREQLLDDHFASLGIALVETALAWWGSNRGLEGLLTINGLGHLEDALRHGRGAILLSAHFTTLEIGGRLLALHAPFHVLYRSHKNPVIETLQRHARRRHFEKAIPRDDLRGMLASLKQNRPVWYAPDQDFGRANSLFVPFFGIPAATLTATSRLARLSGAPVVPFFPRRLPGTRGYELSLLPALEGFPGKDIEQDTRRIMSLIEARIRQQPEQYLWVHRRFKTRPPGKAPVYDSKKGTFSVFSSEKTENVPFFPVHDILLVTLSNIGDALMTTPVMEALHAKHPQAIMDIVADPRSSELFAHCPYLNRVIHRDKSQGWRGSLVLIRELRKRRYDLIVDLRTDGLAWLLRARRRLTRRDARHARGHAVERHMAVIRRYTGTDDIPRPRLWLNATERQYAGQVLNHLPGRRWLALGPGARWEPKRWPPGQFRELVQRHRETFDAVVLLGSRADAGICRTLADGLTLPCLDLAGQTGLLEAAAVLSRMHLFIGNDSGLGHLAAAAGIPTLTLFGPGEPRRYHPWNHPARWLQSPTGRIEDLHVSRVAEALGALPLAR